MALFVGIQVNRPLIRLHIIMKTTNLPCLCCFGNYQKVRKQATAGLGKTVPILAYNLSCRHSTAAMPWGKDVLRKFKFCNRYGNSYVLAVPACWMPRSATMSNKLRIVIGPHWMGVIVTICIIAGGTTSNLRMVDRGSHITDFSKSFLYIFITVFFLATNAFLFLTAFSDPGY